MKLNKAYYYFKLDPNIRNPTEVLFGRMEIEGLANRTVEPVRHFYDVIKRPPLCFFDNEKVRIQDFLLNLRTAYGGIQGYQFSGELMDLTSFIERLAYTREIYACAKLDGSPKKLGQTIFPFGVEGKNIQHWVSSDGGEVYCLFRIIANMFFLEQLNNVVLCSAGKTRERQIERMTENIDRLTSHIMENIRGFVPRFPRDSNWKEFEDFVDEPNEITLYLTQFYGPPYKAKFHPRMIRALINFAGAERNKVTGDFMLGSGTLAIESVLLGLTTRGSDISPLSEIVAKAKIDALSLEPDKLLTEIDALADSIRVAIVDGADISASGMNLLKEKGDLRDRAIFLNRYIRDKVEERYKAFFLCALASVVSSAYKMKNKPDVFLLMKQELWNMWKVVYSLREARRFLHIKIGKAIVTTDDARTLSSVADNSIDLVITSPPYSTAIDYVKMDLPQLLLLELIRSPRELDEKMLGTHRKTSDLGKLGHQITRDTTLVTDEESRFGMLPIGAQNYILDLKDDDNLGKALFCYRFLYDMWDTIVQLHRVLKPEGKCIIIIGNNSFKVKGEKREFRNGDFLEQMALNPEIGFQRWRTRLVREYSKSSYGTILKEDIIFLRKGTPNKATD